MEKSLKSLASFGYVEKNENKYTSIKDEINENYFNAEEKDVHIANTKAHRVFSIDILNNLNMNSRFLYASKYVKSDEETTKWFNDSLEVLIQSYIDKSKISKKNRLFGLQSTVTSMGSGREL